MASEEVKNRARQAMRALAAPYLERGEATAWFNELYQRAAGDTTTIPWADGVANSELCAWLEGPTAPRAGSAVVVGCGLGDDAEELARRGFAVTAFDIAPHAIAWCRERFPTSRVSYAVADLLAPPLEWVKAFTFVFEAYTLQALPLAVRHEALRAVARLVAPGGHLLVLCRARDEGEAVTEIPWPLTRTEVIELTEYGLENQSLERYFETDRPDTPRFRAHFQARL